MNDGIYRHWLPANLDATADYVLLFEVFDGHIASYHDTVWSRQRLPQISVQYRQVENLDHIRISPVDQLMLRKYVCVTYQNWL
jgi:hypothetical protein